MTVASLIDWLLVSDIVAGVVEQCNAGQELADAEDFDSGMSCRIRCADCREKHWGSDGYLE